MQGTIIIPPVYKLMNIFQKTCKYRYILTEQSVKYTVSIDNNIESSLLECF